MQRRTFIPLAIVGALLPLQVKNLSKSGFADLVEQAWKLVNDRYYDSSFNGVNWQQVHQKFNSQPYNSRQSASIAIRSLLAQLQDPTVRLLTADQTTAFISEVSGKPHIGIGLAELLSVDLTRSGQIKIITPIPGTPAARAGLQPGDVILSVAGVAMMGKSLADAMSLLRGQAQTSVKLALSRAAKTPVKTADQIINVTVQRVLIQPVLVHSNVQSIAGKKIGHIVLPAFTETTAAALSLAIKQLLGQGVDGSDFSC